MFKHQALGLSVCLGRRKPSEWKSDAALCQMESPSLIKARFLPPAPRWGLRWPLQILSSFCRFGAFLEEANHQVWTMNTISFHLSLLNLKGYSIPWQPLKPYRILRKQSIDSCQSFLNLWQDGILSRWVSCSKAGWRFQRSKSLDVRELQLFGLTDVAAPWTDQDFLFMSFDKFQGSGRVLLLRNDKRKKMA